MIAGWAGRAYTIGIRGSKVHEWPIISASLLVIDQRNAQ
jgi:hypothetical protein